VLDLETEKLHYPEVFHLKLEFHHLFEIIYEALAVTNENQIIHIKCVNHESIFARLHVDGRFKRDTA
jgi:hypothetical protein